MASTVTELLRRRFGGKSKPYDAEVEYLETDGHSWIVTNYIENPDVTIMFKYRRSTWVQYGALFGNNIDDYHSSTRIIFTASNDGKSYVNFVSRSGFPYVLSLTMIGNDFVVVMDKNGIQINQTTYTYTRITGTANNTYLALFARDAVGARCNVGDRFYYFKIADQNNNLILDFIPVRVGTTGYMYDKVSGQLFGNAGTGDFILGNDK